MNDNSYMQSLNDAKEVLKASHEGKATVLSTNVGENRPYVKYEDLMGFYNNNGTATPTNIFLIKGVKSATVVPVHPSTTKFKWK